MSAFAALLLGALAFTPAQETLEESMAAFVVAIGLYEQHCAPISERDHKVVTAIAGMLKPAELNLQHDFFEQMRKVAGDQAFCIAVRQTYHHALWDEVWEAPEPHLRYWPDLSEGDE